MNDENHTYTSCGQIENSSSKSKFSIPSMEIKLSTRKI